MIPLFNVILIQESIPNYFSWLFLIFQGHLQGQKVNFKVKSAKIWLSMETIIATSVIPYFDVFFIGRKNYVIFLIIQGHRQNQGQGLMVNFKVKSAKNMIFHKYNYRYKCNTSFWLVLTGETIHVIVLLIQGHCQGQKVNFEVKGGKKNPKKYNQVYL